jgi:hypothetical protein
MIDFQIDALDRQTQELLDVAIMRSSVDYDEYPTDTDEDDTPRRRRGRPRKNQH